MDISPSAALFLALLGGLSAAAYLYNGPEDHKGKGLKGLKGHKEGFSANLPQQIKPANLNNSVRGRSDDAFLPGAPFGEISNAAPRPYKNPVLERVTLFQINSALEDLRAFLDFDAKQLEDRSDPNIQLPLTKAKADFQRLQDEYSVLTRTPGIQSQLTQQNLYDIRANMRYLQREARSLKGVGLINEGFEDGSSSGSATQADLNELVIKIYAEMQRLSASGTSDPITQARLTALTNMRLDVQGILTKLDNGDLSPQDIPISKADISKVLPLLSNLNDPLPTVLKSAGLSPILANLLPVKAGSKESDYLAANQEAINSAINTLVKGLSWKVELEYTSENKATAGIGLSDRDGNKDINSNDINSREGLHATGFPSQFELATTANPLATLFNPAVNDKKGSHSFYLSQDEQRSQAEAYTNETNKPPAKFDWKGRAQQIRQAIKARGMDPADFGCLTAAQEASLSPTFSWRGYSKMICNRLTTTLDPGLPETCGCPPQGWLGWSS